MDNKLHSFGYEFKPSKYSPPLGYSGLKTIIPGQPAQRFFDVKALHVPTYDGRFYHQTIVTRHEFSPAEKFQICLGEMRLESFQGDNLWIFSYGGSLVTTIDNNELICEISSDAPLFEIKDDPGSMDRLIADEIIEMLALLEPKLGINQDELYSRLSSYSPYQIFLSCLVSLQNRIESASTRKRREGFQHIVNKLHKDVKIIQDTDGWDGNSPDLDELLSSQTQTQ